MGSIGTLTDLAEDHGLGVALGVGCAALVISAGLTAALYLGLGTLGWKGLKSHIVYNETYHKALKIADKNKDRDLDSEEVKKFFKEIGVTKLQGQKYSDVKPAFKSLNDYVKKWK